MSRRIPLAFGSLVASNDRFPRFANVSREVELEVSALASSARGAEALARLLDLGRPGPSIVDAVLHALARGRLVYERWTPTPTDCRPADHEVDLRELASDEPEDVVLHAVVLELVDVDDVPVAGAIFKLVDPDGKTHEGQLDEDGRAEVDGIRTSGDCKVCFPEFDQTAWDYVSAIPL